MDASENDTTTYQQFDKGRWYRVRLVVRDNHISAWIDDNQIVEEQLAHVFQRPDKARGQVGRNIGDGPAQILSEAAEARVSQPVVRRMDDVPSGAVAAE